MTKCTITIQTEIISHITGLAAPHRKQLYEHFGFFIENHRAHPKVQAHMWDGKIRFFTQSGVTYTLLLEEIMKEIDKLGYEFEVIDKRTSVIPNEYKVEANIFKECFDKYNNPFVLRDYQCTVANILLDNINGIVVAATSAGKGSIICAICKAIISTPNFKVIVIVPNTTLVNQSVEECKQYNLDVGEFSGRVKDTDHDVVISTWQTIKNQPEILYEFKGLVVDECFSGDMLVTMSDFSEKKIKDVVVRDIVKSYDFGTGSFCDKVVTHVHHNLQKSQSDNMLRLTFDNGVTEVTENHIFFTTYGPKKAKDLTVEDDVLNIDYNLKDHRTSWLIKKEHVIKPSVVYDLTVDDTHNYYVNGCLVSNCHGARANILKKLLTDHGNHIAMRFGVTGTMPKNKAQEYTIKSSLGPVRYTISAEWLQQNGYISTLNIRNLNIIENIDMNYFPDYESEVVYLCRPERILKIAEIIQTIHAKDPSKNILCLVNHKNTGKILTECLTDSFYIDGDVKSKKRTDTLKRYASEDGVVGVATFGVASTGVSQDRIHVMIVIDAGKSFIKVIQSIGRGLRKGGGKSHVDTYDIGSNLLFSHQHYKKRLQHYNEANYPHKTTNININDDVVI